MLYSSRKIKKILASLVSLLAFCFGVGLFSPALHAGQKITRQKPEGEKTTKQAKAKKETQQQFLRKVSFSSSESTQKDHSKEPTNIVELPKALALPNPELYEAVTKRAICFVDIVGGVNDRSSKGALALLFLTELSRALRSLIQPEQEESSSRSLNISGSSASSDYIVGEHTGGILTYAIQDNGPIRLGEANHTNLTRLITENAGGAVKTNWAAELNTSLARLAEKCQLQCKKAKNTHFGHNWC